jgi:hypothetical protein
MEIREVERFKSISGFAIHRDIIAILNIYNRAPVVTPPQFIPAQDFLTSGRHGYYVGLCTSLNDKNIEELRPLLQDMMVDGEEVNAIL